MIAPASRTPHPEPREAPWAQPLAWLAVALLMVVAVLLPPTATHLPPFWLATGAATVVSIRSRRWRDTLGLTLLIAGLTGLAAVLGRPVSTAPPLIALCAGVAALQARHTGHAVHTAWRALLVDSRPPLLRRMGGTAHLILSCILLRSLLAGLAMAGLDLLGHWQGWDVWPDAPLPTAREFVHQALVYAAASGLSILVLVPLLAWDHSHLPNRRTLAVFTGAGVLLAGLLWAQDHALLLLPVLAMLAGWVGGISLLSLCVAVDAAALLAVMALREVSPFEGPDGFVVFLLVIWRSMLAGLLMTALHERRLQRLLLPKGPAGARVFRNLVALRRAAPVQPKTSPAPGAGTLWLHIDLPHERPPDQHSLLAQLDPADGRDVPSQLTSVDPIGLSQDGPVSALPSPRLPALMQAVAQALRPSDSVVPIAGEALVVLATGVEARHVARLVDRIDMAMVREGRRHAGPAQLRQAALLDVRAVDVLLTSAQYLTIDG